MAKGDVVMKLDANTASFIAEIEKAKQKLDQFGETAEKSGPKVDKFSSMVAKLQKSIGGFQAKDVGAELVTMFELPLTPAAMMETAAKGIGGALRHIRDEALAGVQALRDVESATKTILQTSASLGEFQQNKKQAESIARDYGMSREKAYALVAQVSGAGMSDRDARTFAETSPYTENPGALVSDVVKIKNNFADAGDARNIVNKIGIAAGESPGVDLNNLTPAVAGTAQILSKTNTSANEAIAAVSVAAEVFKSETTGGDRIQAVGNRLDKLGYNKKGLIGNFEDYQTAQAAAAPSKKLLSETQSRQAEIEKRKLEIDTEASKRAGGKRSRSMEKEFDALTLEQRQLEMKATSLKKAIPEDLGDDQEVKAGAFLLINHKNRIRERQAKLDVSDKTPVNEDWMSGRSQIVQSDPVEAAKLRAQKAASVRATQAAEEDGVGGLKSQAARDELMTNSRARGDGFFTRWIKNKSGEAAQELGGGENAITAAGEGVPLVTTTATGGPTALLIEAIKLLVAKTEEANQQRAEQNNLLRTREGTTGLNNDNEGQK